MSEIRRSDPFASEGTAGADRDAKIEQLLLIGLDHYFGEQYDQAINVWTRALFLDRNHQRARAYIERARSALAERQRESEELLQNGVAAFRRGEGDEARRLLKAAIEGGAPAEEAVAILDRLNQIEASAPVGVPVHPRSESGAEPTDKGAGARRSGLGFAAAAGILLAVLALGGYATASSSGVDWRSLLQLPDPPPASGRTVTPDASLPLPRRGELALARARTLAAGGHLHEALTTLEGVRATDPQRSDADRLTADIQRQLLALIAIPESAEREKGERRVP